MIDLSPAIATRDSARWPIQADFPSPESVVARLHYLVRKLLRNESNFPRATKLSESKREARKAEKKRGPKENKGVEGTRAHIIIIFPRLGDFEGGLRRYKERKKRKTEKGRERIPPGNDD